MIQQLIQSATTVGLDGINVDFETLSEDAGPHFLEFLRELSIECHKNNLVLSVDNPVPEDFTSHYDRREQGLVVDYVVIMGYDEHYVGSEAGSVASLPWVEQGVEAEGVTPDRTLIFEDSKIGLEAARRSGAAYPGGIIMGRTTYRRQMAR